MTWQGNDRRSFPRVLYPCLVKIKTLQGEEQALLAHTENIGVGGICVTVKNEIKLFADVTLEIDLLDSEDHFKAQGRVVWTVRRKSNAEHKPMFYDVGIEFKQVSIEEKKRLQTVLEQMIKKGAKFLKPYV